MKTMKPNKSKLAIIVLILLSLLSILGAICFLSLPHSTILPEFNRRCSDFEKLKNTLFQIPKLDLIIHYDQSDLLTNKLLRNNMKVMINEYYSKDWFSKPLFIRFDSNYESIYSFEFETKPSKTYSFEDIEKKFGFEASDIDTLFLQMRKCDVNVISKGKDIIEFSNESFLNSTSLDFYDGYLFYRGPMSNIEKEKHYSDLKEVGKYWFQFRRTRIVFPEKMRPIKP